MSSANRPVGRAAATGIGAIGIVLWASETALANLTAGLPTFETVGLAFVAAALLTPAAWRVTGENPLLAFRQPWRVWLLTVPALVAFHACIYYAVPRVPAAPAALLQGCTPLFIVLGSALLPGARLRWWHVVAAIAGLEGVVALSGDGALSIGATPLLGLIGLAAGLWGLYSLLSSRFGSVPTSAMGVFYGAAALVALACHGLTESWVTPSASQAAALLGLGLLPMGLALFCWDYGLKRGDVRALGSISYVEPLVGAGLVVLAGQGEVSWSMLVSGIVILGAAALGSADLLDEPEPAASAA